MIAKRNTTGYVNNNDDNDLSCEIQVQVQDCQNTNKSLLGLLDTSAHGAYVKRSMLKHAKHIIEDCNIQVRGRNQRQTITQIATFFVKLIDFTGARTVKIRAYVEDHAVGKHDIVIGMKTIQQLSLIHI